VRLRVAQVLLGAAGLAALLAIWAWLTGGFRVHLLGVPVSVRGEHRAAFVALALASIGLFLHEPLRRRAAAFAASSRNPFPPPSKLPLPIVLSAAALLLGLSLAYGSRAAGGADAYGYVGQADLWRTGSLRIPQPFAASVPWPNGEWTFSPLGYKPSDGSTIVPTYAPGYPLLMALFSLLFGAQGAFYVSPVCGAALVLLTYAIGTRLSGPVVGAISALCVACSPTVVFMTLSVMSDVPVAAFWSAAVLVAMRRTLPAALAAGIASGIAIVIRPNLVLAAVIPLLAVAWPSPGRTFGPSARRTAAFAAACAPFALFIAWLFDDLYGSPLRSGYGDSSGLFALDYAGANLARYPSWLLETQGPLVFLFLLSPLVARWRGDRTPVRWLFAAFVAIIFGSYVLYIPFDAWWYLRFLLPAFPFIFVLAADTVWTAATRLAPDRRALAMTLFALVMLGVEWRNADSRDILAAGRGEEKYLEVAQFLNQKLPGNAVVYGMQHSGSVRYYTGRLTLRYDYLPPDWLDRSIEYMRGAGYEPFFVLDDWEVPAVRERFAAERTITILDAVPAEAPCTGDTFLFRVKPRPGEPTAVRIPELVGCD
jgi:hypothetical protein